MDERQDADELRGQVESLTSRLEEAESTIRAISSGEVDAFLVRRGAEDQVLVLDGVDRPYRLLIERMNQGAMTVSLDGTIFYANRRIADLLGAPHASLMGTNVAGYFDAAVRPALAALLEEARRNDTDGQFEVQRPDGTKVPVFVTASTLLEHEGIQCLVFTDLTRHQREELERERLVEAHAARIAAEELAASLREADRRKDEFLAMLAHELRGPLAPLRNGIEILNRMGATDEEPRRVREMMSRQVSSLVRLVDDLLDVARVTHGKIKLQRERTDLCGLIARAVESSRPIANERGHELAVELRESSLPVHADAVRVSQAILNLLSNAAKFTPRGGRITVAAAREGSDAVVRVRDNGVGIAPDMLARIFDLFAQADASSSRLEGGLGIGLTLARRLVEMHGGRLEAASDGAGRGSEFTLRLPLEAGATPAPRADAASRRASTGKPRPCRILVVDDNRDSAVSLGMLLRMAGHDVRLANDSSEALAAAHEHCPELVLLDIGLPGMTGYEVAERIRAGKDGRSVRIVAVSGYGRQEDRARARAAGFDAHLVKPVDAGAIDKEIAAVSDADGNARTAAGSVG